MKNFKTLLLILTVIGTGTLFSQPSATLTAPVDGDRCVPLDYNFTWDFIGPRVDYTLQVTENSGDYNNPVIIEDGLTNEQVQLDLPNNSATYYWRVLTNFSNTVTVSDEFMFVTQREGTTLSLPEDETTCLDRVSTFSWAGLNNVDGYTIEVSEIINFNNTIIERSSGTNTSIELTMPEGFEEYYWRVSGSYTLDGQKCITEWSEPFKLRTSVYPPVLTTPTDGEAGISFEPTLNWEAANGAKSYNFQLATTNTFGAADLLSDEQGITTLSQNVTLDDTKFDTEYFWRVQSFESSTCSSEWSQPFSFVTRLESTSLTQPADLAKCIELTQQNFSWQPIGSSNTFQIQIDDNDDFSDPEIDEVDITSTSITLDIPDDNRTYYWRVRANTGTNTSPWSEPFEFLSGIFSADLLAPENGTLDEFVALNLEWSHLSNYSNQNLQVSSGPEFSPDDIVINETGINDEEYFAVVPGYGETYYWRVSSTLGQCESGWSQVYSFSTYEGTPELTSPEDGEENLPLVVYFDWTDVEFATAYDIQLSLTEDFEVIEKVRFDAETSTIRFLDLNENTTYYWRVRSVNQYSKSPWSEPNSFVTGLEDASKPQLLYPSNNSEKIPLESRFEWIAAENAETYQLQISDNDNFEEFVLDESDVSNTFLNVSGLDNFETYFWRVRAKNITTESPWSDPARFRTIAPAITESVNLIAPADGATEVAPEEIAFEWTEIDSTTLDVEGAYQIQIATDNSFSGNSVLLDQRNVFRVDPLIFNMQPSATHYWRVRGWNEAGDGPWSDVFSFETLDPSSVNDLNIKLVDIYPNPTSDNLNISFELVESGRLELMVFNSAADNVLNLDRGFLGAGKQNISLDNLNLVSGKYLLMLKVNNSVVTYNFTVAK